MYNNTSKANFYEYYNIQDVNITKSLKNISDEIKKSKSKNQDPIDLWVPDRMNHIVSNINFL